MIYFTKLRFSYFTICQNSHLMIKKTWNFPLQYEFTKCQRLYWFLFYRVRRVCVIRDIIGAFDCHNLRLVLEVSWLLCCIGLYKENEITETSHCTFQTLRVLFSEPSTKHTASAMWLTLSLTVLLVFRI